MRLAGLLFLSSLAAACSIRESTLEIPLFLTAKPRVYPWRVGVVADSEFTPYRITFRFRNTTNFTWSLRGLPDAFAKTLSAHFIAVETFETDRNPSTAPYDLIARMSVDKLQFDGLMTPGEWNTVDLSMRFRLERPDGAEVFGATISQTYDARYRQGFGAPRPPPAFDVAFEAVFRQLAKRLVESDIKLDP